MNGIVNVLKPPGMSSSGVVSYIRKLTGEKRVGHAGTLDPGAAGVLPVCIGRSTRLSDFLMSNRKEYIAEVFFGIATDTLDSYGTVTEKRDCCILKDDVITALDGFRGEIMQTPPAYSALKINGKPSYELARRGEIVTKPPRKVNIYEAEFLRQTGENRFLIRVLCSKGTYIRVICEDLGKKLSVPAHMSFLLRTQSGGQRIEQAFTCDELKEMCAQEDFSFLLPPESALLSLPRVDVPAEFEKKLLNGVALTGQELPAGDFRVYCNGVFFGMGEDCDGLKIKIPLYELK